MDFPLEGVFAMMAEFMCALESAPTTGLTVIFMQEPEG